MSAREQLLRWPAKRHASHARRSLRRRSAQAPEETMFNAAPDMHHEIARQHQQTLLDDARSLRQTERPPHRTGLRVTTVALIACLGVGAIGLSQAKAATTRGTAPQTATRTNAHTNYPAASRIISHRPTTRIDSR